MRSVHLVTDSTCYLPADVIAEHNIRIVPLRVNWDENRFEKVLISGKLFDRLRQSKKYLPLHSRR